MHTLVSNPHMHCVQPVKNIIGYTDTMIRDSFWSRVIFYNIYIFTAVHNISYVDIVSRCKYELTVGSFDMQTARH